MFKILSVCIVLLACSGCNAPLDHREEAQAIVLQLTSLLQEVDSGEQLVAKSAHLKRLFNALAEQMIAAANQPVTEELNFSPAEKDASEQLRLQLNRVCSLSGGYEVIEKCQEEALHRVNKIKK